MTLVGGLGVIYEILPFSLDRLVETNYIEYIRSNKHSEVNMKQDFKVGDLVELSDRGLPMISNLWIGKSLGVITGSIRDSLYPFQIKWLGTGINEYGHRSEEIQLLSNKSIIST